MIQSFVGWEGRRYAIFRAILGMGGFGHFVAQNVLKMYRSGHFRNKRQIMRGRQYEISSRLC